MRAPRISSRPAWRSILSSAPAAAGEDWHLEGRFTSAEQAEGTITIHIWVIGTDATCELGTFPWSASQQPTGG